MKRETMTNKRVSKRDPNTLWYSCPEMKAYTFSSIEAVKSL
mgnify:CR=1 FL=1